MHALSNLPFSLFKSAASFCLIFSLSTLVEGSPLAIILHPIGAEFYETLCNRVTFLSSIEHPHK